MDYLVSWEINIEADSPEEAAQEAKEILQTQVGPVLDVVDEQGNKTRVDFLEFVEESMKAGQPFRAESASLSKGTNPADWNGQEQKGEAVARAHEFEAGSRRSRGSQVSDLPRVPPYSGFDPTSSLNAPDVERGSTPQFLNCSIF